MKLIVLDGHTLNPGDISWEPVQQLIETICYDQTAYDETANRIGSSECIMTNKVVIDDYIMSHAQNLKYIGVLATGYNNIDLEAATRHGIVVTNIPAYSTNSVAQLVFAHLLAHLNHVEQHNAYVQNGGWCKSLYNSFSITPQTELAGKTMGIVGFGNIGQKVAEIAHAFGMNVLISSRNHKEALPKHIKQVSNNELFTQSDFISLNCALTNETNAFVDKRLIGLMKPTAILINTGRGPLINETDLAEALNNERIAGASLDVLTQEPPLTENPLLKAKNCIITPHMAWTTIEARTRLMNIAAQNLEAFLKGSPINKVN